MNDTRNDMTRTSENNAFQALDGETGSSMLLYPEPVDITESRDVRDVYLGSILTTMIWIQALTGQADGSPQLSCSVSDLAVVHGFVRQFRGSDGRGTGQGSSQFAARSEGDILRRSSRANARGLRCRAVSAAGLRRGDIVLLKPVILCLPTARLSRVWPPWMTRRRSLESRLPSSVKVVVIAAL